VRVIERLQDAGHEALLPAVRARPPPASSPRTSTCDKGHAAEIAASFPRARKVGAQFGVMLYAASTTTWRWRLPQRRPYSDGRRPDTITYSTARRMPLRRRFHHQRLFL